MVYTPNEQASVENVEQLRDYLRDELRNIARESSETIALDLRMVSIEPKKPRTAMIVYADGIGWNPGAGEGHYTYRGGLWVPLTPRDKFTTNRTYYVRTDGSDSNTGRADNAAGAFLTIQKAIEVAYTLDLNGSSMTIQVRNGTFAQVVVNKPFLGGDVFLTGDVTTPGNCIINNGGGTAIACTNGARIFVKGFRLTATGGHCVQTTRGAAVIFDGNMEYGAASFRQIDAESFGQIYILANYSIIGGATHHFLADEFSFITAAGKTVTLTGTPAFSGAFITCSYVSICSMYAMTFSGAATGSRFNVSNVSNIRTNGGGANYFPGNAAGTAVAATFGDYS